MKPAPEPSAAAAIGRLKLLPRGHRIAHLRALLRYPLACAVGREQLAALLRDEMIAHAANENHPT
jgi:hypothetical protein